MRKENIVKLDQLMFIVHCRMRVIKMVDLYIS